MKTNLGSRLLILALLSLGTQTAFALSVTLGQQHFTDGQTVGTGTFNTATALEPSPFNGFIGSDVSGPNFSANWTFSYATLSNVIGGSLMIGILDSDSAAPGDQVASFTLNGIDLTASLNSVFNSSLGGANGQYDVYTLALTSSTFAALGTGAVTFALSLQNGQGVLGSTPFNGAGLDFSTLDVTTQGTQPPPQAPEPATASLMLAAFPWLIMRRRKKA